MTWEVRHADYEDLLRGCTEEFDAITTDPPYAKKHWHMTETLCNFAARALKPGGSLVMLTGQYMMPFTYRVAEDAGLQYRWTCNLSLYRAAGKCKVWYPNLLNGWKPIIWFQKPPIPKQSAIVDWHEKPPNVGRKIDAWGQGMSWANYMMDIAHVQAGDRVLDPMMGLGYTVRAAHDRGAVVLGTDIQEELVTKVQAWMEEHDRGESQ